MQVRWNGIGERGEHFPHPWLATPTSIGFLLKLTSFAMKAPDPGYVQGQAFFCREREVKLFVIGRKNWLFSGSPEGAVASAVLYTLIGTAKKNGLDPNHYLETVLDLFRLLGPDITDEDLDAMLPWSEEMQATVRHIDIPQVVVK